MPARGAISGRIAQHATDRGKNAPHPANQPGRQQQDGDDEERKAGQQQQREFERRPDNANGKRILTERCHPVGHRFRRCIDQHATASFCKVRACRKNAAQKAGREGQAGITLCDGGGREQRSARNPDEGVNRVPEGVQAGNLVRKKLRKEKQPGDDHDRGMRKEREVVRQRQNARVLKNTQKKDYGIEPNTTCPAQPRDECQSRERIHGASAEPLELLVHLLQRLGDPRKPVSLLRHDLGGCSLDEIGVVELAFRLLDLRL